MTTEEKIAEFKRSSCYKENLEIIKNNLTGVYTWEIIGEGNNIDFMVTNRYPNLGEFVGTYEEVIKYAAPIPDFFTEGLGGKIKLKNPPVKAEEPKPRAKPYMVLPKTARELCWNYDGIIVGGYVKFILGEVEAARDLDIIVPLHKWPEACRLVPSNARANCFGGFKFKESNIEVDVWPGDALQTLRDQYPKGVKAYCPKTSLVIKLEVV